MKSAYEFALYFMRLNLDQNRNSFSGNMKLQKLLFFANMIHIARTGSPLFSELVAAWDNGCVVPFVQYHYHRQFNSILENSKTVNVSFSQEEQKTLDITVEVFGKLSASELSELNHEFPSWKKHYNDSLLPCGYDRDKASITTSELMEDVELILPVLQAYDQEKDQNLKSVEINGVIFSFEEDFTVTDEIRDRLVDISKSDEAKEDGAYFVTLYDGELVVY